MRSGRSRSLYLFIRRAVKHCSNYWAIPHTIHNFIQYPAAVKVNSICGGNYWGWLACILTHVS